MTSVQLKLRAGERLLRKWAFVYSIFNPISVKEINCPAIINGPNGMAVFLPALPNIIIAIPITDPRKKAEKELTNTVLNPK